MPALTALLSSSNPDVQSTSCSALSIIVACGSGPAMAACVDAGAIPCFVELLGSTEEGVRSEAARALGNLTCNCAEQCLAAVAAAGAIPSLVRFLGRSGGTDTDAFIAADTLISLCIGSSTRVRQAAAAGAVQALQHVQRRPYPQHLSFSQAGFSAGLQLALSGLAEAAAAPPASPPRVCAAPGCGAVHGLRLCAGCRSVRYCGEACSRAHWRAHKAKCRRLQAARAAQQQ